MPKAAKERPKHSASLAIQLQHDKNPETSPSKRSKRKRKAQDDDEETNEQIISGKMSRQILALAREQQEEEEENENGEEDENENEEEMKGREQERYVLENDPLIVVIGPMKMKKRMNRNLTPRRLWEYRKKTEIFSAPLRILDRGGI